MTFKTNRFKVLFFACTVLCCAVELYAAGTPAGTVIQSRSRVTFTSRTGTYVDTAYSAILSITIAQKGGVNITPATNARSTDSDSTNVDYALNIINSGNGADRAKLSAVSSRSWVTQIYSDANNDGILQPSELSAGTITQTPSVPADAQTSVILRVKIPRNEALNGSKDTTIVTVRSAFDTVRTTGGTYITSVRTAGIDPFVPGLTVNDPSPSVGQQVTYSFTVTNNGSVAANNVIVSDRYPNGLSFVSGSAAVGSVNGSSNPVVWNIGTLAPGQSITITGTFTINAGILPGTILTNQFGVSYSVGANNYSVQSNPVSVTVEGILEYSVQVLPFTSSSVKELGDTVAYRFSIRNTGAFKDVIELSTASTQALSWKLFRDANNNSAWDPSDILLTDTNDSGKVDVDSLAAGDSVRIFSVATVPKKNDDQLKDSLTLTAVSSGDHSKSAASTVVTTMNIPVITLEKTAFPAGDQPAGSVISYLISYTNSGSVAVSNFSIVDSAPDATEYIKNSVKVNGIGVIDNSGNITISADELNRTVVTVAVGTLAAKAAGTIEFKVKIK